MAGQSIKYSSQKVALVGEGQKIAIHYINGKLKFMLMDLK
jgi:hypothetical protein